MVEYERSAKWLNEVTTVNRSNGNVDRQQQRCEISIKRTFPIQSKQKHLHRSRNPLHSLIPSVESLHSRKKAVNGRKGIETIQPRLK
jgi:hypothetical protein